MLYYFYQYTVEAVSSILNDILPRQIRLDLLPLQPVLTLPIQNIPLLPMRTQIQLRLIANLVFTPCQISIPCRILLRLFLWDLETPAWVHPLHPVLVEQQRVEDDAPAAGALLKQEEEAAVGFVVHFDAVEGEAAGYGYFHLGDGAGALDVDGLADDAVEYCSVGEHSSDHSHWQAE